MANNHRMDAEEEALFRTYPYALYFVQSPSTVSHSNSADLRTSNESAFHSPLRSESNTNPLTTHPPQDLSRFALSRYSSSRGSNNSFLHEKKIAYDLQSHGTTGTENGENRLISVHHGVDCDHDGDDDDDEEEEDDEEYFGKKGCWWWWRYLSFRTSSSLVWITLQIIWRFLVSLAIALVVFYIVTKPPPPNMSIKILGIREFGLGEGVDGTGVTTKILTCNCSMDLVVENKSKLFNLHVHPPIMELTFASLPLAISYGPKLYAGSDGTTSFQLNVATKNKPMYGAGRAMQDMLDMRKGLPLAINVRLRSSFWVVWGLIKPKFHHEEKCLLVIQRAYDKKHRTQAYNSSCIITT
ncbi:uncharacterized protein LOC114291671 isoform X2 [Camellia sinensis]|uniref:uncharacterized protein LOC114291671 isoform X2 n=1 Tax=Camellia sinensis TaxID=4442 RepID=UPI001036F1F4|nr:uncharacterized protein LOC114291671 isoform X2 [Camellia sinensis]